MTIASQRLGERGEGMACVELERRGYSILARRHRSHFGEIDIIAKDADTVVFVEVKTRTDREYGDPAEAVTPAKQRRIVVMAEDYFAQQNLGETACRFDVVTIDFTIEPPLINHYQDAFRPGW